MEPYYANGEQAGRCPAEWLAAVGRSSDLAAPVEDIPASWHAYPHAGGASTPHPHPLPWAARAITTTTAARLHGGVPGTYDASLQTAPSTPCWAATWAAPTKASSPSPGAITTRRFHQSPTSKRGVSLTAGPYYPPPIPATSSSPEPDGGGGHSPGNSGRDLCSPHRGVEG